MELNLYEDMLAEKRMKFYIDIYYIFFIKKSVANMLYSIRQHDHSLIEGKMKKNKQLSSINLCTYFTLCVEDTHKPGSF